MVKAKVIKQEMRSRRGVNFMRISFPSVVEVKGALTAEAS